MHDGGGSGKFLLSSSSLEIKIQRLPVLRTSREREGMKAHCAQSPTSETIYTRARFTNMVPLLWREELRFES